MLLYRPLPFEDECLISYLIRVAEGNGLKSPSAVVNIAGCGMKNNRLAAKSIFTGKDEIKAIAKILKLPVSVIKELCFKEIRNRDSYRIDGIEVPSQLVRFHSPRVCPGCIREYGYARAIWNIAAITACPEHKCNLVDENDRVTTRLTWYRDSLGQFQDNEKIHLYHGRPVNQGSLRLSNTLSSLNTESSSLLHEDFDRLKDRDIFMLLYWLSLWKTRAENEQNGIKPGKPAVQKWTSKELISFFLKGWGIIENWPYGYYEILDYYSNNPMSSKNMNGIMKCFRDLYNMIKKDHSTPWRKILSNEFDRYIAEQWHGRYMSSSKKMTLQNHELRYQTRIQAADYLNCTLAMLDTYENNELIIKTTTSNGTILYKTNNIKTLKEKLKSRLSFNEVCTLMEVKKKTLRELVEKGIIKSMVARSTQTRDYIFLKSDIENFIDQIKKKCI